MAGTAKKPKKTILPFMAPPEEPSPFPPNTRDQIVHELDYAMETLEDDLNYLLFLLTTNRGSAARAELVAKRRSMIAALDLLKRKRNRDIKRAIKDIPKKKV